MAYRKLGTMLQAVGQNNVRAARADQTYQTDPNQVSITNSTFVEQGQIEVALPDGTFEVFIHTQGMRQTCQPLTDEPLAFGTEVWVSKTKDGEWVIHGSVKG